jgi:hypothetical protein
MVRHIGSFHAYEENFRVICGVEGCPSTYNNFLSYKKHMYRMHRSVLEVNNASLSDRSVLDSSPLASETDSIHGDDLTIDLQVASSVTRSDKHKSALLLMKALAVSKVSNTAIDDLIIGDFGLLLENRIQKLRDDLTAVLSQKGIELDAELSSIFQKEYLTDPFGGLQSVFLRERFYIENMGLLVSY